MTEAKTISVSRQLRESLGWRLIVELVKRSPKGLHIIETHPPGGDHDCLSLHDGSSGHVLDLDRNHGIVIAGAGASPNIWELLVSEGPYAIAGDIEEAWLIDRDARPLAGRSANLALLADIAALASPHGWEWRSGMFDPGQGPPGPIGIWFAALDELPGGVLGTMTLEPIDRAEFRFWFLTRDLHKEPMIAIDIAGTGWIDGAPWALADDRKRRAFTIEALSAIAAIG